jgi:hypothetical protein
MSLHRNPDVALVGVPLQEGSATEGTKIEPNGTFVGHASVASLVSAVGIGTQTGSFISVAAALAAGATQAIVQAQTASVSYRLDGTAPTSSLGVQIAAGASVALNMADAAAAQFISATGAIFVTFTM